MLAQESLVSVLPTPTPDMVHHAFAQGLEVPGDMSLGENSRNDAFERAKKEQNRFPGEFNAYKMEKGKPEQTLLEKEVANRAIKRSAVDLESTANCLKTVKCLLMKTNKGLLSCSSRTTIRSGRVTDKFLKHIRRVYLTLETDVERATLKCSSAKVSELKPFILKLRKDRKRRSEEVEQKILAKNMGRCLHLRLLL